jgi:tetratricopeptide (TPR) repeat protein
LRAYNRALALQADADAYFGFGRVLLALGRYREGMSAFRASFRLNPAKRSTFVEAYPDLCRDKHVRRILSLPK